MATIGPYRDPSRSLRRCSAIRASVTKVESKAVLDAFADATKHEAQPFEIEGRHYFALGTILRATVTMTRCELGAGGIGASQEAMQKVSTRSIRLRSLWVGIAFSMDKRWQAIGDILVAENLRRAYLRSGISRGEISVWASAGRAARLTFSL
jgi:hypothetical protein